MRSNSLEVPAGCPLDGPRQEPLSTVEFKQTQISVFVNFFLGKRVQCAAFESLTKQRLFHFFPSVVYLRFLAQKMCKLPIVTSVIYDIIMSICKILQAAPDPTSQYRRPAARK